MSRVEQASRQGAESKDPDPVCYGTTFSMGPTVISLEERCYQPQKEGR